MYNIAYNYWFLYSQKSEHFLFTKANRHFVAEKSISALEIYVVRYAYEIVNIGFLCRRN